MDMPTASYVSSSEEIKDIECLELCWTARMANAVQPNVYDVDGNDLVVHMYNVDTIGGESKYAGAVIERDLNNLSKEEEITHYRDAKLANSKS